MELLQDVANHSEEYIILEDSDLANNPYEYNKKRPICLISLLEAPPGEELPRNRLRWIAVIKYTDVRT